MTKTAGLIGGNRVEQRIGDLIPPSLPAGVVDFPVAAKLGAAGLGLLTPNSRRKLSRKIASFKPILAHLYGPEATLAMAVCRELLACDVISDGVELLLQTTEPDSKLWGRCMDSWLRLQDIKASRRAELVTWIEKARTGSRSPLELVK